MNSYLHANLSAAIGHIANGDLERAEANLAQLTESDLEELRAAIIAAQEADSDR